MTTNATQLREQARPLREAGLDRLTISLDSLRADRFTQLTRRSEMATVMDGIRAAKEAGFERIKVNTVLMRGINDDEISSLLDWAGSEGHELRFIEYMDVGGATGWHPERVFLSCRAHRAGRRALRQLRARRAGHRPRRRIAIGCRMGRSSASSRQPPSRSAAAATAAAWTADGMWYLCLYARSGYDLKRFLRSGGFG
jgi:cyclic pyranopterin phosphate synthase